LTEPTTSVVNVLSVDVEEYYHGVEFANALGPDVASLPSRVVPETERVLAILEEFSARATFFTLGIVAQRYPRLVQAIVERGHEIASHGWDHTPVYALGRDGFRRDVKRAKRALEQAAGRAVWGYRAPNYSIRPDTPWATTVLVEEGYRYDSSVHPIIHDRYAFPGAPRFPHVVETSNDMELWEIPVGTARLAGTNLPLGGGFFRLFPFALLRGALLAVNRGEGRPVVLYVHPWELDPDQPRPPMTWRHRFRHYVGIRNAETKLRRLLACFRFTSIERAFAEVVGAPSRLPVAAG
jgi:polysaccharide deacetylase family protein (PEP-CTERM system associated)